MPDDIDYAALFGLESTGEKEAETADPPAEDSDEGEQEREAAEPAEEDEEEPIETGEETGDDVEEQNESGDKKPQTKEERARYAAQRREAEKQAAIDAAVAQAKQEAQQEAQKAIDEAFRTSGLVDPYTKKPITTKAEYDAYRQRYETEAKARLMRKAGMTDEEFNRFIATLPEVKQAQQLKEEAEAAKRQALEAQAKLKLDEQMKQIGALNPEVRELGDLTKMPTYPRFYELVKKGLDLVDAYKLANIDSLTQGMAQASRQAALNSARSKDHLSPTATRGAGAVTVPSDELALYRELNPGMSEAEIQKHYNKYIREKRK
jgi:hypothetical protein